MTFEGSETIVGSDASEVSADSESTLQSPQDPEAFRLFEAADARLPIPAFRCVLF